MLFDALISLVQNFLIFTLQLSTGSFPKPLSTQEERECFELIEKNKDMTARDKLISHNLRLVVHVIKKYYSSPSDQDDLISIGTIGLIKAVDSFNSNKGTRFATYAARCIQNEVLMQFRSAKKTRNTVYISDPLESSDGASTLTVMDVLSDDRDIAEETEQKQEQAKMATTVQKILFGREKTIIELRYGNKGNDPKTQQMVATELGISRSYVSRIEKKALQKLKMGFCKLP